VALAAVGRDLPGLSQKLGLSSDLLILESAWEREIGGMREFARIVALDNSSLVIEVDSAAVMQELSLRRKELVRKLNRHLPAPWIQYLTVRISQHNGR
jgi:hypothetical protein